MLLSPLLYFVVLRSCSPHIYPCPLFLVLSSFAFLHRNSLHLRLALALLISSLSLSLPFFVFHISTPSLSTPIFSTS